MSTISLIPNDRKVFPVVIITLPMAIAEFSTRQIFPKYFSSLNNMRRILYIYFRKYFFINYKPLISMKSCSNISLELIIHFLSVSRYKVTYLHCCNGTFCLHFGESMKNILWTSTYRCRSVVITRLAIPALKFFLKFLQKKKYIHLNNYFYFRLT